MRFFSPPSLCACEASRAFHFASTLPQLSRGETRGSSATGIAARQGAESLLFSTGRERERQASKRRNLFFFWGGGGKATSTTKEARLFLFHLVFFSPSTFPSTHT